MNYDLVEWEHFMLYRERQSLPLADLGLVLINGDNRLSKSANSNGVGKSAVPTVINWVKFGETFPGQDGAVHRGDAVACRFTTDPCHATLDMHDEFGIAYRIERQARPAKLSLFKEGVLVSAMDMRDTQAKINDVLGYGPMTFRHAVVYGQSKADRIMMAGQADILRTLDEIQGIDFRKALDKAKGWRDQWKDKLANLEVELTAYTERLTTIEIQITELINVREHFAQNKKARIAEAEAAVAAAEANNTFAAQNIHALERKKVVAEKARAVWTERVRLGQIVTVAATNLNQASRDESIAKIAYDQLEKDLNDLVHSPACPKCRTKLDTKMIPLVKKAFAPDLHKAKAEWDTKARAIAQYKTLWEESQKDFDDHRKKFPTVNVEKDVLRMEGEVGTGALRLAQDAKKQAKDTLVRTLEALQAEQKATWEGTAALESLHREQAATKLALEQNEKAQAQAKRTIISAEFWVEAFGDRGIRSLLFESVEPFLNERLQHHLEIITAGEAELRVSALSALKSGAVREKLSLMASWMWGADNYSMGSGGQGCRIDLAAFAALQDLAASRSARPIRLRVFDEPGDGLDSLGMEIFARWMRDQIQEHGTGLLITHNDTLASLVEPDKTLTVVLDSEGSHLVEV